jgi:hypothetical protein
MWRVDMCVSSSMIPCAGWRSSGQRCQTSPSDFFSIRIIALERASACTLAVTCAGVSPASSDWRRTFSSWYSNHERARVP